MRRNFKNFSFFLQALVSVNLIENSYCFRPLSVSALLRTDASKPNGVIKEGEEKFIVRSPYSDVEIPEVNLAEHVFKDVEQNPDNVSLVRRKDLRGHFEEVKHLWLHEGRKPNEQPRKMLRKTVLW